GCAFFEGEAIRVRQFVLPGLEHERAVLKEFADFSREHGVLVTFNGRTFDSPLIETRYLFHRLPFPLEGLPHLDMLHPSRRLWRTRPTTAGQDPEQVSCSLSVLEKDIAGVHRIGDVPGFEIPGRYFQFVRDGDARPLEAVMEHNRLDLISTAAVTARVLRLLDHGPAETANAPECLGLARLYERAGETSNAEVALLYAIDLARLVGTEPEAHGEALRRLAWLRRRTRRPDEAAQAWSALASLPGCRSNWRCEAREALAIFHEHRSRDLGQARSLVMEVLGDEVEGRRREEAVYRLQRIERKLSVRSQGGLIAALDATLASGD
ncbi:MAG: ribonuclease H-like domain-containing protein, partial [Vicinamibacterales bacterium]